MKDRAHFLSPEAITNDDIKARSNLVLLTMHIPEIDIDIWSGFGSTEQTIRNAVLFDIRFRSTLRVARSRVRPRALLARRHQHPQQTIEL